VRQDRDLTWVPISDVDATPFVVKALASKPGFVMDAVGGTTGTLVVKTFEQQGYPSNKIIMQSAELDDGVIIKPAGKALDGVYADDEFANWSDTSDPGVKAYLDATKGIPDNLSQGIQEGYIYIEWLYTAAKAIGGSNFNSATLTHFLQTANNVPIPMSRMWINPGPAGYPQAKEPYNQILQDVNGTFVVVTNGTDSGWVRGLG
jgi:hypothetical protein